VLSRFLFNHNHACAPRYAASRTITSPPMRGVAVYFPVICDNELRANHERGAGDHGTTTSDVSCAVAECNLQTSRPWCPIACEWLLRQTPLDPRQRQEAVWSRAGLARVVGRRLVALKSATPDQQDSDASQTFQLCAHFLVANEHPTDGLMSGRQVRTICRQALMGPAPGPVQ
jgi:hypothetical protein